MISLKDVIETRDGTDYQRDNFDTFLKKVGFSFKIPAIHVAGTNGKGSTSNYIASIYKQAGLKVGLFTSPELFEINEMIRVNGVDISDEDIKSIVESKKKEIKKFELSTFEILTYVAFTHFINEKCDVCVIECGMGGETDATNIFVPVLSIITSVSLEHTAFLGKSISEIALQKAGIMKDDVPVLIGKLPEDAISVISDEAKRHRSKIFQLGESHQPTLSNEGYKFSYGTHYDLFIQSHAYYSVSDACMALDAIDILQNLFPVSEESMANGLKDVNMPCRMDIISKEPLTIIDGAHNPEAFDLLAKSLQKHNLFSDVHVLLASFKDKNIIQMLSIIGAAVNSITLTTFDHIRARKQEDYFLFLSEYEFIEDPLEAYRKLREQYPEGTIVITGSLAFAAYMKKRLTNE